MDVPEVVTKPHLQTQPGIADVGVRARVRNLDAIIEADPDNFMQTCRMMAGVAIDHMDAEEEAPIADLSAVRDMLPAVRQFLVNNDLVHAEFDTESDTAIYDHEGVISTIKLVQAAKGQVVKQGHRHIHRENEQALTRRDNLSALKLYLYARRQREWQRATAQGTAAENGAA